MSLAFGWTLEYVRSLTGDDFERCDRAAQRDEARRQILACTAAAYPVSSKNWREEYQRMLHRSIGPEVSTDEALTTEDLATLLATGG